MKVRWLSKQWARFDLSLIKLSRPLAAINTLSNLTVAIVIGLFLFGVFALVGFVVIVLLGYVLHKSGFFMATVTETFDQQSKELWYRQQRYLSVLIAKHNRMNNTDLDRELAEAKKALRL